MTTTIAALGIGGAELFLILIAFLIGFWGYSLGNKRVIGGIGGMLLGFFLSIIGILILLLIPKKPVTPITYGSVPDELKKFKELFDAGAITEAEYNTQKARLLK